MYPAISRYDIPFHEYRSPTNTPPSSWSRSLSDHATTSRNTCWDRKICRSSGLMTPFGSTIFVLSAVGISFSVGWAYSSPAVISMPSSDMTLLDDHHVIVRPRPGLWTETRGGGLRRRRRRVRDDQD